MHILDEPSGINSAGAHASSASSLKQFMSTYKSEFSLPTANLVLLIGIHMYVVHLLANVLVVFTDTEDEKNAA